MRPPGGGAALVVDDEASNLRVLTACLEKAGLSIRVAKNGEKAIEFARRGLDIVIVNPTAPVGEAYWKPTPTGNIIVDFVRGKMPA